MQICILMDRYVLPSGKMVLEYSGAVHESIFTELRVRSVEHLTGLPWKLIITFFTSCNYISASSNLLVCKFKYGVYELDMLLS
jgi:hypothetical protein